MTNKKNRNRYRKRILIALISFTTILASVATFSGFDLRDLFRKDERDEAVEESLDVDHTMKFEQNTSLIENNGDSNSITISTEGNNSPAIIGNDVDIQYNADWSKEDSLH